MSASTFAVPENAQARTRVSGQFKQSAKNKDKANESAMVDKTPGFNFKTFNSNLQKHAGGMNHAINKSSEQQLDMAQKMLLKQLQCQTPDDSFDPNAMMSTMMSMLTIAQQSELVNMQKQNMEFQSALFYTSLSSFKGELVEHSGDKFDYTGNEDQEIIAILPAKAKSAVINIIDSNNQIIHQEPLSAQAGRNSYKWDGAMNNTNSDAHAEKGIYRTTVTAFDEEGKPVTVQPRLKSRVTEIAFDEQEIAVPYAGIFPIYDIKRRSVIDQATKSYTERAMPMDSPFQPRPIKMPGEMTNVPPGFDDAENIVMRENSEPNLTTEQLRQKRLDYFDSVGAQQHRSTSIEM